MNEGIELFKKEALLISDYYEELHFSEYEEGLPRITGELILRDGEKNYIDKYSVLIKPSNNYPFKFPIVFEMGGRLPLNIDWHVFPNDGHCCIKSIPEESMICLKGITLIDFIEKQLKPYFFNQKHRELYGYFLHERSHGLRGNIEFFEDFLQIKNLNIIERFIHSICNEEEPKCNSKCLCGSKRKFKKCHRRRYRKIKSIPRSELLVMLKMIKLQK
jgi:SEC-C motif-containing protein